jgi:hypothetical protein
MVPPVGHTEPGSVRRQLGARERWMIAVVLGALAALAAAIVIAFAVSGPSSASGCIHLVLPAATGAQEINQCGAPARATCASVRRPGSFTPQAARSAAAECRKARLPVGP